MRCYTFRFGREYQCPLVNCNPSIRSQSTETKFWLLMICRPWDLGKALSVQDFSQAGQWTWLNSATGVFRQVGCSISRMNFWERVYFWSFLTALNRIRVSISCTLFVGISESTHYCILCQTALVLCCALSANVTSVMQDNTISVAV